MRRLGVRNKRNAFAGAAASVPLPVPAPPAQAQNAAPGQPQTCSFCSRATPGTLCRLFLLFPAIAIEGTVPNVHPAQRLTLARTSSHKSGTITQSRVMCLPWQGAKGE